MLPLIYEDMTWSFSRLSSFTQCPYKFYLTYMRPQSKRPLFFSSYGSFMHNILEMHYKGFLDKHEMLQYYLDHFDECVEGNAPNGTVFSNYYGDGARFLSTFNPIPGKVLSVEERMDFEIEGVPFTGFSDLILERDGIMVVDHKARNLKQRSGRKTKTKSDDELDRYLRQLYLYSIPIAKKYGNYPDKLAFDCYRSGTVIEEPFNHNALSEAKRWAIDTIEEIGQTKEFYPSMDYCRCRYLCDVNHACEYCAMAYGDYRRF